MRSRAIFLAGVLVVAGLLGGVTASSVTAATKTTVTWKVSSMTAGQAEWLSDLASTNSPGVKTWSKTGSCRFLPEGYKAFLSMGTGKSCTLTLKIAKSGKYPAKTSTKTIIRAPSPTTTTTTTTTTAPPVGLYSVGDTGPAGGTIFWVDMTRAEGSQYFEAACDGWFDSTCGNDDSGDIDARWGCVGTLITGADGTAIGTGEQNTTDILNGCEDWFIVARVADRLVLGGQTDWFLPSKDELNQMWVKRKAIGGMTNGPYWSSSETGVISAWGRYFDEPGLISGKGGSGSVRPIRSF